MSLRNQTFLLLAVTLTACSADRTDYPGIIAGDAGQCGALGAACCANASCGTGLTCEANVCQQGRMGEMGKSCTRNGDCASAICVPLQGGAANVCTAACVSNAGCTAGWLCAALEGAAGNVCQCAPSDERCDGLDNDCDGIVDNQPGVDALCVQELGTGNKCLAGACQLPGCTTNGDCLGAQVCDPITRHCVVPMFVDGGPGEPDAGVDGGRPDGGRPDGGVDGGSPDAGVNPCFNRYDCAFGETCRNNGCASVSTGATCAQDSQCARGQTCNFSHQCEAGCAESRDCVSPQFCSTSSSQCVSCGRNNPCPSGQYCSSSSGSQPTCVASMSCSTSSSCNSIIPGTVCSSGSCRNCTGDSDCQSSPYGTGYTCSPQGFCSMETVTCDIAQCSNTCYAQGLICDTANCGCTGTANCNNARCGGAVCGAGTSCDQNTCTCTQNNACGGSTSCASLDISGIPFSLCALQSGTCDASCNCSSLTNCSSCGANQICVDSGCADIAVDSLGHACSLTKCRGATHPCKNANTGAGCICSNANSDGFAGSTSPVSCE